jgi:two-component system, NtrC family, sensor kinase
MVIVAVLAFSVAGVAVLMEHGRTLEEGRVTAARLSQLLEEQTARTFQAVDLTLTGMVEAPAVVPDLKDHDPAFQAALQRRRDTLPFVRALFIVGADGLITHDTDYPATPRVSLADRPYFRVHRTDPGVGLHIGRPLISRSVDRWFISLSRRMSDPSGRFRGVAVAAVEPRYFEQLYRKLELGEGDSIALFHRDGTLLSRTPYLEDRIGASFADTPLFSRELPAAPDGSFRTTSRRDQARRVVSYRSVEGMPLVIAVGLSETALLAGWRRTAIGAFVGAAVTVALVCMVLVLVARAARQRQEVSERLAQAQKLEALGRMTGGIAHDFNNVLNVVATNLQALRRTAEVPSVPLEAATRAVRQGTTLAAQLLTFARRQDLALTSVQPNELVSALVPMLEQAAGPSVDITTHLGRHVWPCVAEHSQLDAAILNLVLNARDAMPQGKGEIRISTENCPPGARLRPDVPSGDYVRITVADNGTGMPPDVLRRATEPFYTTKGAGVGTGLGLSQIYGFIRQAGGELEIESAVGLGTSVHLYFRRATEAPRSATEPVAS